MKRVRIALVLSLILTFATGSLMAQTGDKILGEWLNEDKDAKVEIYKQGDKFFGKIVWLKDPNREDGSAKLDDENPDDKLKSRAIMGLMLLKDFVYDDEEWEDGEIYDPKSGKTYSCYMEFEEENKIMIKGYIGVKWVGKTTYWTRTK
ncbi:MAG: SIGNAL peptide protein [Bacteroidetes bacterium 4572_77]|nr:MAG: SIGNAL peptide protein [Bacteroidetes bacterium 4572_77]